MYPAHTLSEGKTAFAAGAAANFALGDPRDAIDAAAAEPAAVVDKPSRTYATGAMAVSAISPGVCPFVSGRAGLGYDAEGGLTFTGRTIRVDGRYALQDENLALSAGLGGSALLKRRNRGGDAQLSGLNLEATTGWGVDVPVVFGWRSSANIVWWWTGARGGYERLRGQVGYKPPGPTPQVTGDVDGRRTFVMGLMGLAVGFRHVHAAVEVQGGYQHAEGTLWGTDVDVSGVTVSPSAALIGRF